MTSQATARRSYGTGRLFEKTDSAGRVSWYGKWRQNGTQIKRRIGPKKENGSKHGLTKRQAEAELRRLIREIEPIAPASESITISELGRRYIEHLQNQGRKKSTQAAVETALNTHLEPYFRGRAITSVRYEDVADLVSTLRGKGLSPKSMRNYIGTLRTLYRFAMHPRRRWATSNPCGGIELDGVPHYGGIRYLDPEQVELLVANVCEGAYQLLDATMFLVAAMTGLRMGELCALRWRDVDWLASTIRVQRSYVMEEIGSPKSKRSLRSVPMAPEVGGALERYFQASGEPRGDQLVFADPEPRETVLESIGEPALEKTAVLRRFRRALNAAGLPRHRFHDLRHTFGTACAAAGVPMRTLQEWMGHADIQTTQIYADYAPRTRDAELVAAAFARSDAGVPLGVPT
jgi:integrase